MHLLDSYSQTFLSTGQERSDKQRENFKIATFSLVNSKLNIGVQNTGDIPINITRLWIQNTTTTDWFQTYSVKINVPPGTTASSVGQSVPLYINSANSYNIKLVTERGNSQQFAVNSANSAPISIQLLALPPSVASGLTTELLMIVTNNGSSTLTNIAPAALTNTNPTVCNTGPVSPSRYATLPPGSTATFKWDVTVNGGPTDSCTITASLQNGYAGNSASAKISVSTLKITSTDFNTIAGVLTINYAKFQWNDGSGWHTGWSVPKGQSLAFQLNVTNNNSTGPLYLSQHSVLYMYALASGQSKAFFLVGNVSNDISQIATFTCPPATDYCKSVPANKWMYLNFSATQTGGNAPNQFSSASSGEYAGFLVLYGKYSPSQGEWGTQYAQNIPYLGIYAS